APHRERVASVAGRDIALSMDCEAGAERLLSPSGAVMTVRSDGKPSSRPWRRGTVTPFPFFLLMNVVAARAALDARVVESSSVMSLKVEPRDATASYCCLCEQPLDLDDSTVWVPGIDLPTHEHCLTRELELRLAN